MDKEESEEGVQTEIPVLNTIFGNWIPDLFSFFNLLLDPDSRTSIITVYHKNTTRPSYLGPLMVSSSQLQKLHRNRRDESTEMLTIACEIRKNDYRVRISPSPLLLISNWLQKQESRFSFESMYVEAVNTKLKRPVFMGHVKGRASITNRCITLKAVPHGVCRVATNPEYSPSLQMTIEGRFDLGVRTDVQVEKCTHIASIPAPSEEDSYFQGLYDLGSRKGYGMLSTPTLHCRGMFEGEYLQGIGEFKVDGNGVHKIGIFDRGMLQRAAEGKAVERSLETFERDLLARIADLREDMGARLDAEREIVGMEILGIAARQGDWECVVEHEFAKDCHIDEYRFDLEKPIWEDPNYNYEDEDHVVNDVLSKKPVIEIQSAKNYEVEESPVSGEKVKPIKIFESRSKPASTTLEIPIKKEAKSSTTSKKQSQKKPIRFQKAQYEDDEILIKRASNTSLGKIADKKHSTKIAQLKSETKFHLEQYSSNQTVTTPSTVETKNINYNIENPKIKEEPTTPPPNKPEAQLKPNIWKKAVTQMSLFLKLRASYQSNLKKQTENAGPSAQHLSRLIEEQFLPKNSRKHSFESLAALSLPEVEEFASIENRANLDLSNGSIDINMVANDTIEVNALGSPANNISMHVLEEKNFLRHTIGDKPHKEELLPSHTANINKDFGSFRNNAKTSLKKKTTNDQVAYNKIPTITNFNAQEPKWIIERSNTDNLNFALRREAIRNVEGMDQIRIFEACTGGSKKLPSERRSSNDHIEDPTFRELLNDQSELASSSLRPCKKVMFAEGTIKQCELECPKLSPLSSGFDQKLGGLSRDSSKGKFPESVAGSERSIYTNCYKIEPEIYEKETEQCENRVARSLTDGRIADLSMASSSLIQKFEAPIMKTLQIVDKEALEDFKETVKNPKAQLDSNVLRALYRAFSNPAFKKIITTNTEPGIRRTNVSVHIINELNEKSDASSSSNEDRKSTKSTAIKKYMLKRFRPPEKYKPQDNFELDACKYHSDPAEKFVMKLYKAQYSRHYFQNVRNCKPSNNLDPIEAVVKVNGSSNFIHYGAASVALYKACWFKPILILTKPCRQPELI